jgi:hypothetical protein
MGAHSGLNSFRSMFTQRYCPIHFYLFELEQNVRNTITVYPEYPLGEKTKRGFHFLNSSQNKYNE